MILDYPSQPNNPRYEGLMLSEDEIQKCRVASNRNLKKVFKEKGEKSSFVEQDTNNSNSSSPMEYFC